MKEIRVLVEPDHEVGGYCAWWNDPNGGGIATQGDDLEHLQAMVLEATELYFEEKQRKLPRIRLHFIEDPVLLAR